MADFVCTNFSLSTSRFVPLIQSEKFVLHHLTDISSPSFNLDPPPGV